MRPFEPRTYTKEVLAPLKGQKPDPFARYLLDLEDDDDAAISARMAEIRAYWNNNTSAPGSVGQTIKALIREHEVCIGQLQAAADRHELRDSLRAERAQAQAAKWTTVDEALEGTYKAHGGIPGELRPRIVDIGRQKGLTEADVESHITEVMRAKNWQTVVLTQVTGVAPLPDTQARQIQQVVARFAEIQQHETKNTTPVRSLFEALDLQIDADVAACGIAIGALDDKLNRQIRRDSDYGAAGRNLLQSAKTNLGNEDAIVRYRATIVAAIKDQIRPHFEAMSVDDAIDQQENARLLRLAAEAGLPDVYAREVVTMLFDDSAKAGLSIARVEGERVEIILCAACGTPDAIGSGHKHCLHCGQELYRDCGACHEAVPKGEAVCRYCGHSMQAAIRLDAELRDGTQALSAGRPEQAGRHAAAALLLAADSATAQQLAAESQMAIQQAQADWRVVRDALGARRLYVARAAVQKLVADAGDVQDAGQYPSDIQSLVGSDLAAVDRRLEASRTEADPLRREHILAEVLALAVDCEPAQRALSQIPAQPPERVEARIADGEIQLHWAASPSPGVSGYVVVRGVDRAPVSVEHGERVGETAATAQVDSGAAAGSTVAYAVFAQRAGTSSQAGTSEPLFAAFEAADIQATVSSGEARLSWRLPSQSASVEVERRCGNETVTLQAGGDGLVDADLRNGEQYRYTVRVRYGAMLTAGVVVTATPAEPPRAVALQGLEATANGLQINWASPPAGSVSVVRSQRPLELAGGTELRRADLMSLGSLLPGDHGSATDPNPSDGWFYTPVTIVGDRAIVGTGLRWTDIAAITDLRVREAGTEATLSWNWPAELRHAVVTWREGGVPGGPEDPESQHATVSRATQQEVSGGLFRISRSEPGQALRVAVYGAQMRDGELVVGSRLAPSSRASLDPALARETISYDVRVKGGFRGKSLEFALSGSSNLPEVVLIVSPGDLMPLGRDAGQPVARLGGDSGPAEIAVPLGSLPKDRPLTVRAFLAADSAQARFALRDPADLTKLTLR